MALKKIKRYGHFASTGSYRYEAKIVHRDNKDYYNFSGGSPSGSEYRTRVPSLKRSIKTWNNFWKLFPRLKARIIDELEAEALCGLNSIELKGNIIIRKDVRTHGGNTRVVTTKYLKTW